MILSDTQIKDIILNNPNKALIQNARNYSAKLALHVLGWGLKEAIQRNDYFENEDVFAVRNKSATSNKDLFARLLKREQMVFSAKGGANYYDGLDEAQTANFDELLDNIRFNMSIRKWVKEMALQAYRVDPMAVLFAEVDLNGNAYPTYKSTNCIYDYLPNGRKLEYIVFRLKAKEAKQYLNDAQLDTSAPKLQLPNNEWSQYYRVLDDAKDYIVENDNGTIKTAHVIPNVFEEVPAIIASDLIDFSNNQNLLSPLDDEMELAGTYLEDRSIRDLSKKYAGFPKGYEPLVTCGTCLGTGQLNAKPCPKCTEPGATKGTGFKLRTKVSDILRVPMPAPGQVGGITNPANYIGYVERNVAAWDKQDTSLNDIENQINDTYWGTTSRQSTTGPTIGQKNTFQETATKTLADLQPIYARLNATADWAESTENGLCDLIGKYNFDSFKSSQRTYGRYYILETPDELMEQYLDMKTKGAPQTSLFDTLKRYYHSYYANDPIQLSIKLKLIDVEPFIHQTVVQVQATNPSRIDFFTKVYYSEWLAAKDDNYLLATPIEKLLIDLQTYAEQKMVEPAETLVPPTVGITETIKNTN